MAVQRSAQNLDMRHVWLGLPCRSSSSVKNTSSGLRNPSLRKNRARRTRQLRRCNLNRDTPQDSSSIAGPARRIRSSRWTRLAGRRALSAIARRRIEARAHSDRSCPGRTRDGPGGPPGGRGGPRADYFDVSFVLRFGPRFESRRAVFRVRKTSRNRKENGQLTSVRGGTVVR